MSSALDFALKFVGQNETDNQKALMEFFKGATGESLNPKTTPWCAKFVNSVLASNGIKGTGSNMARSFLKIGTVVPQRDAQPGDIIVFPRGNSTWQGHVGIIKSVKGDKVQVLGGNQGGRAQKGGGVTVQTFSLKSALGVRRITQQVAMAAPEIPDDTASSFA